MTPLEPSEYLICSRQRGQQKKHVAVCNSCRWQQSCEAYQEYRQKNKNNKQEVFLTKPERSFVEPSLLNYIQRELKEIIVILGSYPHGFRPVASPKIKDTPEGSNILIFIRNELHRLKSLF